MSNKALNIDAELRKKEIRRDSEQCIRDQPAVSLPSALVRVNGKRLATFALSRLRGPRLTAKKLSVCGWVLGRALLFRAPSVGLMVPSAFFQCRSGRFFNWSRTGRRRGVLGPPSLTILSLFSKSGLSDIVSPDIRWLSSASVVSPCVRMIPRSSDLSVARRTFGGVCLCRSAYWWTSCTLSGHATE